MRRGLVRGLIVVALSLFIGGCAVWYYAADSFDRRMNTVSADPEAPVPTAEDLAVHRSLFVADLHADTLKWRRDLLERGTWGHVDLPRLVDGNVGLQVFTIVTKSPIPRKDPTAPGGRCVSGGGVNVAAVLAAAQGRPAWSLRKRMRLQVERLKDAARRSRERDGPELRVIETADDLRRLIADRTAGRQVVGAILGIEGGHWVGTPGGPAESVDADMQELHDLGIRMFAPTHRFDNALSGSSEGCTRGGLTPLGRRALERAQDLGMAIDLSHISEAGMSDAMDTVDRPFLISHIGIAAGCEPPCRPWRNLSDAQIRQIVAHDGVIGVGYWPQAIGPSVWRIAEVMRHVMEIADAMGRDPGSHLALGSDYDGSVTPFFDVSQTAVLTTILRRRDFEPETIQAIAGLNACRVFASVLPGGGPQAAAEICGSIAPPGG